MFNSKPTIQNCRNLTPEITDKLDVKSQFNSVSLLLKKILALISKDNADDCRPNCTNNFFKTNKFKTYVLEANWNFKTAEITWS